MTAFYSKIIFSEFEKIPPHIIKINKLYVELRCNKKWILAKIKNKESIKIITTIKWAILWENNLTDKQKIILLKEVNRYAKRHNIWY